jgi:hypothetical protein
VEALAAPLAHDRREIGDRRDVRRLVECHQYRVPRRLDTGVDARRPGVGRVTDLLEQTHHERRRQRLPPLRPTARRLPRMWLVPSDSGPAGPWHEPPQTAL